MKKLLAVFLILSVAVSLCQLATAEEEEPETFTCGDWQYIILQNGTAEITEYTNGEATEVNVPEELDGKKVTSIDVQAFFTCNSFTSITIPDSVINIEFDPFRSCMELNRIIVSPDNPSLAVKDGALFSKPDKRLICYPCTLTAESYEIPQGIRMIENCAFYSCKFLTSITIPDSVTSIRDAAFDSCTSLISIEIPDSVTRIENYTFNECKSLKTILIPDSVTSIGDYAFKSCDSLESITIPDSVTSIGEGVFSSCDSLKSITIPDSVTSIGYNPFSFCSLRSISVSPDHPTLAVLDGVLFSKADRRLVYYPRTTATESYEIPKGIRVIGEIAFYASTCLTTVTIPDSVTRIEDDAFCNCKCLKTVTIPDSVTSIGERAFDGCPLLTLTVTRDSYAARYCKDNGLNYTYPDSDDWLND